MKQVWRPHVRTWSLLEGNLLYWRKYLWNCWDFSAPPTDIWCPPQWFGTPIMIRRPGNCAPFATPSLRPCTQEITCQLWNVWRQARKQFGAPAGAKSFLGGAQIFLNMSNSFELCPTHFSRGRKVFREVYPPTPPNYGHFWRYTQEIWVKLQ